MKRLGQVGKWVKSRRAWCRDSEMVPQVAVLHSEHHFRSQPVKSIYYEPEIAGVEGAVFALLENQLSVDLLDEWALLPRLAEFPLVVAPEQDLMSEQMEQALAAYVRNGGRLLVTGAASYERQSPDFWGARTAELTEEKRYFVPVAGVTVPASSPHWRLLEPGPARVLGRLGTTPLPAAELTPYPAAILHRVGRGRVAYVPWDACRYFRETRYPAVRAWLGSLVAALQPDLGLRVSASPAVDVLLRRRGKTRLVHLINRSTGLSLEPPAKAVAAIPPVGPVEIELRVEIPPQKVWLAGDKSALEWGWADGNLWARVEQVPIHTALVVE
jgi:hypothetical protein